MLRIFNLPQVVSLSASASCRFSSHQEIAHALAIVHVELLLIHPFREGNGRLARMPASLMSFQAGLPPLDFGELKDRRKTTSPPGSHAAVAVLAEG